MSTAQQKPSAFTAPTPKSDTADAPSGKLHPFTPRVARQAAALPPEIPKDAHVTAFGTRLPPELQRVLKTACAERGLRMQDAVYQALWQWLNDQ